MDYKLDSWKLSPGSDFSGKSSFVSKIEDKNQTISQFYHIFDNFLFNGTR